MQKQKLIYISFALIFIALALFLLFYFTDSVGFNTTKHAEWEQDGFSFSYRGSKSEIRKLYIEKDGKNIGKLDISSSASLFSSEEDKNAVLLNSDGSGTLFLVPFCADADGDRHFRPLFVTPDGSAELDIDADVSNPRVDFENSAVFSECAGLDCLVDSPESPYTKYALYIGYSINENRLIPLHSVSVTYHSETNIYCFSESFFDEQLGTLGEPVDDWLLPDEYAQKRDSFASLFTVDIP